jgi:hypothetical protein
MILPLKDINPRRTVPFITVLLIAANVAVFVYQLTLPPHLSKAFLLSFSEIPNRLPALLAGHATWRAALLPLVTSMFLHGGLLHLAGNMLFLWVFGDNVEDALGHFRYLFFYFACGIAAGLLHIFMNLHSALPALGASGAISGVMGAYLILFPRSRVLTLVFVILVPLPAVLVLGWWFVLQFLGGMESLGMRAGGGVAWWAHVGGFLTGIVLAMGSRKS